MPGAIHVHARLGLAFVRDRCTLLALRPARREGRAVLMVFAPRDVSATGEHAPSCPANFPWPPSARDWRIVTELSRQFRETGDYSPAGTARALGENVMHVRRVARFYQSAILGP